MFPIDPIVLNIIKLYILVNEVQRFDEVKSEHYLDRTIILSEPAQPRQSIPFSL